MPATQMHHATVGPRSPSVGDLDSLAHWQGLVELGANKLQEAGDEIKRLQLQLAKTEAKLKETEDERLQLLNRIWDQQLEAVKQSKPEPVQPTRPARTPSIFKRLQRRKA